MQTYGASHPQPGREDLSLKAKHGLLATRFISLSIAVASLAISGCATQEYVRSVTYEYTDQDRLAAERRANQDIHDACYFSGAQYPELVGPPTIVIEGATGKEFRATQSFYCVGTQGGP